MSAAPRCGHVVFAAGVIGGSPCGKPAKSRVVSGPGGGPSSIDGQHLCGRHANFWSARQFVVSAAPDAK